MYLPLPTINPYPIQKEIMQAVIEGRNAVAVIHRRYGKDVCCVQLWLMRALMRVGTHIYLFPLTKQAREVIWSGMDFTGKPFISNIPEALIESKNEARMEIRLINGSRMILAGSNNFNSHMGSNPVTIIYSEYSLHNPLARQYMNPILIQNKGLEIAQYTPRGMNHGYDLLQEIKGNPDYYSIVADVDKTKDNEGNPIITKEDIERARRMGMSDEMIRQEFYCDFEVGNVGAYFTREILAMTTENRISVIKPDPRFKLHTCWDLGGTDATAGWIFQVIGKKVFLVKLLHDSGFGLKYYLEQAEQFRKEHQCEWGYHYMPHDIDQGHQGWESTESRLMTARKHGWNFLVTPKVNFEDGIEAMRYLFRFLHISEPDCGLGIRAMREYQRNWLHEKGCYEEKPVHNWASHIMDALRYLALNYKRLFNVPTPPSSYKYDG
jgi:hypothetical protein